ncbi:MAG: DUF4145 domain-containing protein [Deltaproteobacteria bacterium]|nr:DUF4145 domain-containing protein [Deltaproteobacteria bacterium]
MSNHIPPELEAPAFNCPRCQVFAKQDWFFLTATSDRSGFGRQYQNREFVLSKCNSCGEPTIWHGSLMIYPLHATAEPASEDLPEDVREDFEEARIIANLSPRGAAALLRLAIQKMCVHLGESGNNINADIATLVSKGLPPRVQQALDSVRVIGNEAVHPGTLDLKDDLVTANKLFRLVNFIAQKMITEPREIDEIYGSLPADKLKGIAKRDAPK